MAYKKVVLNLATTIADTPDTLVQIFDYNKRIGNVSITQLSTGASFRLHFGRTADGILISSLGSVVGAESVEDTMQGLFYSVDAGVALATAEVVVAWDKSPLPGNLQ
jgi:hypothetical protein